MKSILNKLMFAVVLIGFLGGCATAPIGGSDMTSQLSDQNRYAR